MTDNENYLLAAQLRAGEFRTSRDPELLVLAYRAISQVVPSDESAPDTKAAIQTKALHAWLGLLDLVDRNIDPNFDPNQRVFRQVSPPEQGDVVLMPGADPSLITDPVARKKYEEDIAANDEKLANIRRQTILRRIESDLAEGAVGAICSHYRAMRSKDALRNAVNELISAPERKTTLLDVIEKLD
ncbi:hypothetical protein [Montanilutibacter psychrotolerans]|uniref:hypothetical protein n=1 Tax=Montanilutibacter psychrotolerans TaxID=1327343 RepID=UPI0011CDFB5D|nr:hypothetical protein [Lysobacter psychrotolerans]